MLKPFSLILLTGGLLLAGCGVDSTLPMDAEPGTPPADEVSRDQGAEERVTAEATGPAIWESVHTDGSVTTTKTCNMTVGSPCTTVGETCTWFAYNNPGSSYYVSKVCRLVNGTYKEIQNDKLNCPGYGGSYTACPDGSTAGLPCGHKGSYCIRECYSFPGPAIMVHALCQ